MTRLLKPVLDLLRLFIRLLETEVVKRYPFALTIIAIISNILLMVISILRLNGAILVITLFLESLILVVIVVLTVYYPIKARKERSREIKEIVDTVADKHIKVDIKLADTSGSDLIHIEPSHYVSPLLGRLLEVLDRRGILTREEIEKTLLEKHMILDIVAQERSFKDKDKEIREKLAEYIARNYGYNIDDVRGRSPFTIYMEKVAKKDLARWEPRIIKLPQELTRFYGTTEFIVLLRGRKDIRKVMRRLLEGYLDFLIKVLEGYINEARKTSINAKHINTIENALETLRDIKSKDVLILATPSKGQKPSIMVSVPFATSLKTMAEIIGEDDAIRALMESILEERIRVITLRLSHLFEASECTNEGILRRIERIERRILRRYGVDNVRALITSRQNTAEDILSAIEETDPGLYEEIQRQCTKQLEDFNQLVSELVRILT